LSLFLPSFQRIVGTFFGGAIGLALFSAIGLTGPSCPSCGYKIAVFLVGIFLAGFIFSYFRFTKGKYAYTFTLAALSMVLVIDAEIGYETLTSGIGWSYLRRMIAVSIGIALAFLLTMFVFPNRASIQLRGMLVFFPSS